MLLLPVCVQTLPNEVHLHLGVEDGIPLFPVIGCCAERGNFPQLRSAVLVNRDCGCQIVEQIGTNRARRVESFQDSPWSFWGWCDSVASRKFNTSAARRVRGNV